MAADEREPCRFAALGAKKLGAAALGWNGLGFEASHRVPSTHRQRPPDRQDRTSPEAGSLVQVIDKNGASVRLKQLRPWRHRGSMDDDIAVGVRTELER
jgi:hypothetical protein